MPDVVRPVARVCHFAQGTKKKKRKKREKGQSPSRLTENTCRSRMTKKGGRERGGKRISLPQHGLAKGRKTATSGSSIKKNPETLFPSLDANTSGVHPRKKRKKREKRRFHRRRVLSTSLESRPLFFTRGHKEKKRKGGRQRATTVIFNPPSKKEKRRGGGGDNV